MDKKLGILGAGESGTGAALLGVKQGFTVFVSDSGKIKAKYRDQLQKMGVAWEEGKHNHDYLLSCDLIVKSPGIPDNAQLIQDLHKAGVSVISEIEFAGRYTEAKKICITGSNGKTTTTMMIFHILKNAGFNVGMAGNIGDSFARQVAERCFDVYVLEISSFQLDGMYDFKADIAIIMNITPDHLDRYDHSFTKYRESKFRLLQNMTSADHFIYYADDEEVAKEMTSQNFLMQCYPFGYSGPYDQGAWIANNQMETVVQHKQYSMSIFDLSLQGKHNAQNSMAASIASRVLDIRKETIRESLSDFQGVEHRLEPVVKVHGIEFINDSKATNINSSWYALETMKNQVVWIAGGVDKGNDYGMLLPLIKDKVKAIICLGKDNKKLHEAFDDFVDTVVDADDMDEAVRSAYYLSKKGDQVLLSPACASFDLFDNYEDRGRQFKKSVRNL
ncbi:MAG: UDP-N-acetylmuramoyl-L-alanine--D-glutamate ligase [Bacteroidales bacterium]|nr:UDP-N-acetylmuramoyl-L-alanine--D-glutamate ligase [Bacteroidales bacterium]